MPQRKIFLFIINRYFNYGLLFIRGIILARFLGPEEYGNWGFITLFLLYFSYASTLGINYATTVSLSSSEKTQEQKATIASSAVIITATINLGIMILGIGTHFFNIPVFSRFSFGQYLILVTLIIATTNLQQVLTNIYRVMQGIKKIAIVETISAILLLGSSIIFREKDLVTYQLLFMLFASLVSIAIYFFHLPFKLQTHFEKAEPKRLFNVGFPLLIYNFSFYLIAMSARTIVNGFYTNEILGYYTLANSLSNAVLLGFQSAAWAIYPDVLTKTVNEVDNETVSNLIEKVNLVYNTACFLLIFLVISALPLLLLFLPAYRPSLPVITILLFAQSILAVSFGFNALSVARNQQNVVAKISIGVVFLITISGSITSLLQLNYFWVAVITLIGSVIYTGFQTLLGFRLLGKTGKKIHQISAILSPRFLVPMTIAIIGSFTPVPIYYSIGAALAFFLLHIKNIKTVFGYLLKGFLL